MTTVTAITVTTPTASTPIRTTSTNMKLKESVEVKKEEEPMETSPNVEDSQDPTNINNINNNNDNKTPEAASESDPPPPPGAEEPRQELEKEIEIRIGKYVYQEPLDQYAPPLARILKGRRHLWRRKSSSSSSSQDDTTGDDLQVQYALASAHLDIGMAHVTAVNDQDRMSPGQYTSTSSSHHKNNQHAHNMDSFDLSLAINAFVHGQVIYHKLLTIYQGTDQEAVLHSSLAALHLQWGEVYQSPHYYFEDDDKTTTTTTTERDDHDDDWWFLTLEQETSQKQNDLALQRFQQSEYHYKKSLELTRRHTSNNNQDDVDDNNKDDIPLITDAHISLAHAYHRIGRCHINAIQRFHPLVSPEELDWSSVSQHGDPKEAAETLLGETLPHLDQYRRGIAKAEEKFQQAVALYRAAIAQQQNNNNNADFEFQIQLKQYLATTLQDSGTAATYAGNLVKAIDLQEEGVTLCQEILDHLPETERHVMIQYVGDTLYGLSGNYMQLGRYEETNTRYEQAMEWYQTYELEPSNVMAGYEVPDDTMEAYEQQLTDYRNLLREINMPDGYPEDQLMYGPNHVYEADLHAALGSAHLSRYEVHIAIDHLKQAIRLYEDDESEENLDRFIADAKVSFRLHA
jgi:tetratricopeptide (TPR) repeat protein